MAIERLTGTKKEHPQRTYYVEREKLLRASFLASKQALTPYLVPHRFEGTKTDPDKLQRAKYGFAISLNDPYLTELMGHVRGATASRFWGVLAEGPEASESISAAPTTGAAAQLWADCTRRGKTWDNFWQRYVLEWMLSSTGGIVLIDAPASQTKGPISQAKAKELKLRPYCTFLPFSDVLDVGRNDFGFSWMKLRKRVDRRTPDGKGKIENHTVVYEIDTSGVSKSTHANEKGHIVSVVEFGRIVDAQGEPTLPMVSCTYGQDENVDWLGTGLLGGALSDIVVDIFNIVNETRTRFRDASISLLGYSGPNGEEVADQIEDGSMFTDLGEEGKLERVNAGGEEVATGISLMEIAMKAWAFSARRNAAKAMDRAQAQSGVSLQAEFQLDVRPLLVEIASAIDECESMAMQIAAQFVNKNLTPEAISEIGVERVKEFRPEDEASRISRIVTEFVDTGLPLADSAKKAIAMRWHNEAELLDMTAEEDGGKTLGDVIEEETEAELAESKRAAKLATSNFPDVSDLNDPPKKKEDPDDDDE